MVIWHSAARPSSSHHTLKLTPAARPSSELYPRQQGADEVFDLDLSKLDLSRLDLSALDLSEDELALLLQLRDEQAASKAGGREEDVERDELREWRERRRAEIAEGRVRDIDTEEFLDIIEEHAAILIYEEVSALLILHFHPPPL